MQINQLITRTEDLNWVDKIKFVAQNCQNVTFSTSFSIEDQVIADVIFKNKLDITVFAIDTGRLPNLTYKVWQETLNFYQKDILAFYPNADKIANYVNKNGINAFYNDVELRHQCCNIRKVEPLKKALNGKELWISGLRKEHNLNRKDKDFFEFDANLNIIKFYPLLQLNEGEIWQYIKENNIVYNEIYDQGYKSIGCDPCSRAVREGEDARSGRWWWEDSGDQECGLHMVDGKLIRKPKETKKDMLDLSAK